MTNLRIATSRHVSCVWQLESKPVPDDRRLKNRKGANEEKTQIKTKAVKTARERMPMNAFVPWWPWSWRLSQWTWTYLKGPNQGGGTDGTASSSAPAEFPGSPKQGQAPKRKRFNKWLINRSMLQPRSRLQGLPRAAFSFLRRLEAVKEPSATCSRPSSPFHFPSRCHWGPTDLPAGRFFLPRRSPSGFNTFHLSSPQW